MNWHEVRWLLRQILTFSSWPPCSSSGSYLKFVGLDLPILRILRFTVDARGLNTSRSIIPYFLYLRISSHHYKYAQVHTFIGSNLW